MPRPIVFISHSAHGDPAATAELKRIETALKQQGYDALIDKERITGGDYWRDCIHVWMSQCQGAVVLLTEKALKSRWVQTEATILAWRKRLDPTFVLLPVLSGGVTSINNVVKIRALEPVAFTEIQALSGVKGAALANKLLASLEPLKQAAANAQTRVLELKIAATLTGVSPALLDAVATSLGVDLGGWKPNKDSAGMIALSMMHAEPAKLAVAIETLAGVLTQERLRQLVSMLSGVWVDRELSGSFAMIAHDQDSPRVAALNASVAPRWTPRCVLACASGKFPAWDDFPVTIAGEDVVGSIVAQVRAHLAQLNPGWSAGELDEEIANLGVRCPGVIVIEPTDPLIDDAEIDKLVARFPSWTILVLTGAQALDAARQGTIRRVEPQLGPNVEADARRHYRAIENLVARSGGTG